MSLVINNLKVSRDSKEILNGISLEVAPGEVHAIMGPNGSGKSTLANSLMGHPKYELTEGKITLNDTDLTELPPNERAKSGLFLSMQNTPEVPGVSVAHFLRVITTTARTEPVSLAQFRTLLREKMAELKIDSSFMHRSLGDGFSGGEKKRMEALQLALLAPKYAILDETDSGLDVDALKIVIDAVARAKEEGTGIVIITHSAKILHGLKPDKVHVLVNGSVAETGGAELAEQIEQEGYGKYLSN